MEAVYLDNCTTVFPKAPGVGEAMARSVLRPGRPEDSPGAVGEKLLKLARAPAGSVLRFTPGLNWGLDSLLSALFRPGDTVLTSPMERGSVYRIPEDPAFPHFCRSDGGLLHEECAALLRKSFELTRGLTPRG